MDLYKGGDFSDLTDASDIVVLYLSRDDCGVCSALRPKVEELLTRYPGVKSWFIDLDEFPLAAGRYTVFTVPAVLVFVRGKETVRFARYFSIDELDDSLRRYCSLLDPRR